MNHESGISFPDAGKIADAYGIKFYKIDNLATIGEVLEQFLRGDGIRFLYSGYGVQRSATPAGSSVYSHRLPDI